MGRQDWRTDPLLFEVLDREFRFTLDAAADDTNHLVDRYLTGPCEPLFREACGLCADWLDHRAFCNPTYEDIWPWAVKFDDAARKGATVVSLVLASTGSEWFAHASESAHEIRLLKGRPQFWHPDEDGGNNRSDAIVMVYRPGPRPVAGAHIYVWPWREVAR